MVMTVFLNLFISNFRNMNKFVWRIFILAFLLTGVFLIAENIFRHPTHFEHTLKLFKSSEQKPNLLFVGSSHAYCTFDTRVFEAELGVYAMNFGSSSQRLETTDVIIHELLKEHKPELIVIDIFSNSLDGYPKKEQIAFQLNTLDNLSLSLKKFQMIDSAFGRGHLINSMSSLYRNHNIWHRINKDYFKRTLFTEPREDYHNGFVTTLNTFPDSIENLYKKRFSKNTTMPKSLPGQWKFTIDRVLSNLEDAKVNYMFINSPSMVSSMDSVYKGYSKLLKEYFTNKEVRFLDLNLLRDSLQITKKHFRDPNHLNQKGALIVSKFLSKYLENNYKLSSVKTNEDHLNRYKHIKENFIRSRFSKSLDLSIEGIRLKNVALYRVMGQKYEVLMEIDNETFSDIPITFQYNLTREALNTFPAERTQHLGKNRLTRILTENDAFEYEGKQYIVFSLSYPPIFIDELVLFLGHEDVSVLTILNDQISENIYDIEEVLLDRPMKEKMTEFITVNSIKVVRKKDKYIFTTSFTDSIRFLKKNYNIGIHIFPDKSEMNLLRKRSKERKLSFDTEDRALEVKNNILEVHSTTGIENIDRIKMFLYDREKYNGVIGKTLWIEVKKVP
tara:strand:+ start:244879 stop:246723 length:1845 start_codon:yes stop_codon:yes gene_type:complete